MMLTAVMGIIASFTKTPVQPNTTRVNAVSINGIGLIDIQNSNISFIDFLKQDQQ